MEINSFQEEQSDASLPSLQNRLIRLCIGLTVTQSVVDGDVSSSTWKQQDSFKCLSEVGDNATAVDSKPV